MRARQEIRLKPSTSLTLCVLMAVLGSAPAKADTISTAFTSSGQIESGTAVVNLVTGAITAPIENAGWQAAAETNPPFALNVGDGSDGDFGPTTYLNFDDGTYAGDHVLHINTDAHPALNFKSFQLDAGWTIRPSGTKPLVIRSLSSVVIDGTIDCSGGNGSGLNSDPLQNPSGGVGRCGGGAGGTGGSDASAATAGGASGPNSLNPGLPGTSSGDGGGGGGAYSQNATSATDGVALGGGAGGAHGSNQRDDAFTITGGGAGGGGGAVYHVLADPTHISSGAGGGGGGGTISIEAIGDITISATGSLLANGGNGGGVTATGKGGSGGAGGGGSILIMCAGSVIENGTVSAIGGTGGTSDGGHGGAGATGRTWITDQDGVPGGSSIENPQSLLAVPGSVRYASGTYTAISRVFDMQNTKPDVLTATLDGTLFGSSVAVIELASADSPPLITGPWNSDATAASGHRYLRYRISLTNAPAGSASRVTAATITYLRTTRDQYDFKAGCGLVQGAPPPQTGLWIALWTALIAPLILCRRLRLAAHQR